MVSENAELTQLLRRKEAELTRAEETISREQQHNQEMVSLIICSWILAIIPLPLHYTERDYQERTAAESGNGECTGHIIIFACSDTSLFTIQRETIRQQQQLVQTKDTELAQAQQQMTQQVRLILKFMKSIATHIYT